MTDSSLSIDQDQWAEVLRFQRGDGAFESWVHLHAGPVVDFNSFTTVLVLECLDRAPATEANVRARQRAVEYIARCEDRKRPGRFGFYPPSDQPEWMPQPLPCDIDDTALISTALFNHGILNQSDLVRTLELHLRPFRVEYRSEASEPWCRVGAFETWLDLQMIRNPVDCTVNVNVLTMLHHAGIEPPECEAIRSMIKHAISWAGAARGRSMLLSPWYPEPVELVYAIDRAVRAGVAGMAEIAEAVHKPEWVSADLERDLPVCGSSDRRIQWTCPALSRARFLAGA